MRNNRSDRRFIDDLPSVRASRSSQIDFQSAQLYKVQKDKIKQQQQQEGQNFILNDQPVQMYNFGSQIQHQLNLDSSPLDETQDTMPQDKAPFNERQTQQIATIVRTIVAEQIEKNAEKSTRQMQEIAERVAERVAKKVVKEALIQFCNLYDFKTQKVESMTSINKKSWKDCQIKSQKIIRSQLFLETLQNSRHQNQAKSIGIINFMSRCDRQAQQLTNDFWNLNQKFFQLKKQELLELIMITLELFRTKVISQQDYQNYQKQITTACFMLFEEYNRQDDFHSIADLDFTKKTIINTHASQQVYDHFSAKLGASWPPLYNQVPSLENIIKNFQVIPGKIINFNDNMNKYLKLIIFGLLFSKRSNIYTLKIRLIYAILMILVSRFKKQQIGKLKNYIVSQLGQGAYVQFLECKNIVELEVERFSAMKNLYKLE